MKYRRHRVFVKRRTLAQARWPSRAADSYDGRYPDLDYYANG